MPFNEKAMFIWCYWDIFQGDTKKIAQALVDAKFEAAYVHTNDGAYVGRYNNRVNCTPELVSDLRNAGLKVYGWGAPYGIGLAGEIATMIGQTRLYNLDGYVIDAEGTWDGHKYAVLNTKQIITEYKAKYPDKPVAWCWWPLYEEPFDPSDPSDPISVYHPKEVLIEAMKYADVGMPMAYHMWPSDPLGIRYVKESFKQWRAVTNKPLVMALRGYNDAYGKATYDATIAVDGISRELGAIGVSWWDMQHAIRIPECWDALTETEPFYSQEEEPISMDEPMGLFTRKPGWTLVNPNYKFIVGAANAKGTAEPNDFIKPIQEEAAKNNLPHLIQWEYLPWTYGEQQWGENNWPSLSADYIFQNFKTILENRSYQGVVVSVNTGLMKDNKTKEEPSFISFGARTFMNRVQDWLKANRPLVPLILSCSDKFMAEFSPGMKDWAHNFESMAHHTVALIRSYPAEGTKPPYLGAREDCPWWRYYDMAETALVLFRGTNGYPATVEGMRKWLNLDTVVIPPPPPVGETDLQKLALLVASLETKVNLQATRIQTLAGEVTTLEQKVTLIEDVLKKPLLP